MDKVTDEIYQKTWLTKLSLSKNQIKEINSDLMAEFKLLKNFDLSYNKLTNVSLHLPALLELKLQGNFLQEISLKAPNLKILNLDQAWDATCFEKIPILPSLESLSVARCKVSKVRVEFCMKFHKNLKDLNLSGNMLEHVDALPIHLESCNLGFNQNLESVKSKCQGLKSFKMNNCAFTEFPSFLLMNSLLTVLDVSRNELESLPDTFFADLKSLENANLGHNTFSKIPSIPANHPLKKLILQFNVVDELKGLNECLTHLDVSFNQLNTLGNLPKSLTHLNASFNDLTSFGNLSELSELKTLYLAYNQELKGEIPSLKHLSDVHISCSPFLSLKKLADCDLKNLRCANNSFPLDLSKWTNLKVLNIAYCNVIESAKSYHNLIDLDARHSTCKNVIESLKHTSKEEKWPLIPFLDLKYSDCVGRRESHEDAWIVVKG